MTTLSNPAYTVILFLQLLHLAVDILCNSATVILGTKNPVILLVLYLIQLVSLLSADVFIFLVFFNTYAFKAGLLSLLIRKFSAALLMSGIYFALTLAYNTWSLYLQWRRPYTFIWSDGLQAVYVFQRMAAILYYYLYKRAALRLGDPKYYEDSSWLRKHFNT